MCPPRLKQAAVACLSVGTSVCLTWVYMGVQECGATPGPGFISAILSPQTMQCATLDSYSVPTMCSCSSFPGCPRSCYPCLTSRYGRVKAQGWVDGSWLGLGRLSTEARALLCVQILKTTLTHRKTGIPHLSPSELDAFLYDFSQPGGLTGPLNYYRNIFR